MSEKHPDDGKFVVIQGGKRVSGTLHVTQQEAQTEAAKLNQLRESQGEAAKAATPAEVKQNLYG
jgi:hypothetical protein